MILCCVVKVTAKWDIHLPALMLAYRTTVLASTGFTPYFLLLGMKPLYFLRLCSPFRFLPWHMPDMSNNLRPRSHLSTCLPAYLALLPPPVDPPAPHLPYYPADDLSLLDDAPDVPLVLTHAAAAPPPVPAARPQRHNINPPAWHAGYHFF